MKRMIRSNSSSNKVVASNMNEVTKNRGYKAAERFKRQYPKAYEVLGR